jgi:hypothetical protein
MDKCAKELSKSASRALGALHWKFICADGMTNAVYVKLYTTIVEPVLFHGAGIWGTKQYSVINCIENKVAKLFCSVERYASNIAIRGDIGWTSCFTKQRLACICLMCRINKTDDIRLTRKIAAWTVRRRKEWFLL